MQDKTKAPAIEDSKPSQPFFVRFLEGQDTPEVCEMTLKYPSDRDEDDFHLEYALGNNETLPSYK
jgi:hypothetical protein